MSQCVPNWDLDDTVPSRLDVLRPHPATSSSPDVPMLDYEMAELTWQNGQLSMHGLALRRVSSKPSLKCAWDRPRAGAGTLESIVNLATQKPPPPPPPANAELFPCSGGPAAAPGPPTKDALVPCETAVDSCSGAATCEPAKDGDEGSVLKKPGLAPREWNKEQSLSVSVSRSGTVGADSWHVPTADTCEKELEGFGLTSTSFCSHGNTFSSSGRPGTAIINNDDHDSVCHSRPQRETGNEDERKRNAKSSSSTRRSKAAAIHNQSERKRRDKINQKMKMLQKLVPNSNKTDKASMLDEVIDYLKQLQAQVHMMSFPSMMMPAQLAMQQQLQMSMMAAAAAATAPMGMGVAPMPTIDMSMNMNINSMAARQSPMAAFVPLATPWNGAPDARLPSQAVVSTDPFSTYLACQPQPMTIEAYSRMVALIQQQQQQLASVSKR